MAVITTNIDKLYADLKKWESIAQRVDFTKSDIGAQVKEKLYERITVVREHLKQQVESSMPHDRRHAAAGILRHVARNGMVADVDIVTKAKSRGAAANVEELSVNRSGIKRKRTIKGRTQQLRGYQGADRNFILHILQSGRDVYYARPDSSIGRGSGATYGRRGAIGARPFMESGKALMDKAAEQYGKDIINIVQQMLDDEL